MAIMLLALWVPVNSHCLLETAGLIPPDECCAESSNNSNSHTDSPCDPGDMLDSDHARAEDSQAALPLLVAAWLPLLFEPTAELILPARPACDSLSPAPPDLAAGWQFSSRAALPVRAPSLIG